MREQSEDAAMRHRLQWHYRDLPDSPNSQHILSKTNGLLKNRVMMSNKKEKTLKWDYVGYAILHTSYHINFH